MEPTIQLSLPAVGCYSLAPAYSLYLHPISEAQYCHIIEFCTPTCWFVCGIVHFLVEVCIGISASLFDVDEPCLVLSLLLFVSCMPAIFSSSFTIIHYSPSPLSYCDIHIHIHAYSYMYMYNVRYTMDNVHIHVQCTAKNFAGNNLTQPLHIYSVESFFTHAVKVTQRLYVVINTGQNILGIKVFAYQSRW